MTNNNFELSLKHKDVTKRIDKFIKELDVKELKDSQSFFYFLQICNDIKYRPTITNSDVDFFREKLGYSIDSKEIFFIFKILQTIDVQGNKELLEYVKQFNKAFLPMKDFLYPMCVTEENNKIEMLRWYIITTKILKLNSDKEKSMKTILEKYVMEKNPDSMLEMYYQVLFCQITNNKYPTNRIDFLKKQLEKAPSFVDGYYIFQTYRLDSVK